MITATKEVVFDCAHMLSGHQGLCKNLHGHTYKVLVTVSQTAPGGRDRLIPIGPSASMVVDFKDLKGLLEEVIVRPFDHAFVYNAEADVNHPMYEAELGFIDVARAYELKTVAFPGRPTAENMARYFGEELFRRLKDYVETDLRILTVRVYETPTSYAEWVS